MSTVESFVNDKINSNKVMVFSGSYCPYCTKAKNVLSKYKINSIEVIELDKGNTGFDMDDVMVYLEKITGGDTVPRVFVDKKFIGGGDDTERLHKNGELKKMLLACAAISE